ncbi:MAG: hypothetical protein U1F27_00925 [Turneriella sp.]
MKFRIPIFDPEASGGNSQSWSSYWMWLRYNLYTVQFYSTPKALEYYEKFIHKIVLRRNSINGILYRNDATIWRGGWPTSPRVF